MPLVPIDRLFHNDAKNGVGFEVEAHFKGFLLITKILNRNMLLKTES